MVPKIHRDTIVSSYLSDTRLDRFQTVEQLGQNAERLADRAVGAASTYWARVTRPEDIPAMFEEWRSKRAVRFGFDNYLFAPLAYAFVLARLGRMGEAEDWLSRFFRHDLRPEAKQTLSRLLNDAPNLK